MHIVRRAFLRATAQIGARAVLATGATVANFWPAKAKEDADIIEAWMDKWMKRDKDVVGTLFLSRFADPMYFLLKPITWKPNSDQSNYSAVTVPIGFVTDFASVPRAFWSIFRPDGQYTYAAIVHDYLYWTQTTSKDVADNIFKFGMEDFGLDKATVTALYASVHLAGREAWDQNARLKASGERRVLKVFPDDPRVSWKLWKMNPSHFE